jgi:hypothetical protein
MLEHSNAQRHVIQYDSIAEMVRSLEVTPRKWRCNDSRTGERSTRWDNNVGYDGACRMAVDGWEEGVGLVSALVDSLPNGARPERSYSAAGDYPDVPRAVSGDPFNMVRRGISHKPRQTMTIAVNCCASGGTPAIAMMNYAAAMVALVDRLENRGVSVELIGMAVSDLPGKRGVVVWTVKNAGDPVDLSAIAFGIGHPAMFRRLCFAAWERMPREMESYSYGRVVDQRRDDYIDIAPDALLINGVGRGFGEHALTIEAAVEFATKQINDAAARLGQEPIAELEVLA